MSRHMSSVHASKRAAQGPPTLTRAPVPKLTIRSGSWAVPHTAPVPVSRRLPHPHPQPQQGPPPTKRPAKPLPNLIPLQAAVLPRTTTSPSPSPAPSPTPTSTPTAAPAGPPSPTNGDDPFDAKKKNSFFDQLRLYPGSGAGTSADDDSQLVCVHCGHEAKTQSELVRHNKLHQGGGRSRAQGTSTRCQHCRHRCRTSADLALHLRSCVKAAAASAAAAPAAAAEDADAALDDSTRLTTESEMEYQITAAASAGEPAAAEDADDDDVDHPCPPDDAVAVASDDQVGVETAPGYGLVTSNADLAARAAKENVSTPAITTRKVFKCPYCPFWAATASRFHVHMVGHLNKKPFACSTCKYRSNWRWDITKHIRIKQERDPIHSEAKILMTDDTGRRNYSKYYQHLLWLKCAEPSTESLPPSMTSSQPAVNGSHITSTPPEPVPILPAPPRLTRAPAPRSVIQAAPATLSTQLRPPPPLQAAGAPQAPAQVITTQSPSERAVQKQPQQQAESPQQLQSFKRPAEAPANNMGPDPKKSNADIKKTVWRCKQCHFRDGDRAVVLAHVKGHYRQQQEAALAKLKNPPVIQGQNSMDGSQTVIKKAPFRCDICPFVSVSDSVMQTHMGCHKERSDVLFKCFYCPFYVSTKQEVIQHMAVHPQQNSKTEIMNSSVLNSTATPRNVATPQTPVSGTEQIQVKKEVEQESPSDVKQQKQSSHRLQLPTLDFSNMTEAPFCWVLKEERLQKMLRCRFCPHINQRRANMQEHEKMHSKRSDGGEGSGQYSPYPCPDCTYVCNNAGVLSTHMKVHLPINPHAYAFYDPYRSESLQMKEIAEQFGLKLKTEKPPQKSSPPKETSDVGNENKLSGINVMSLLDPNQSLTDAVLAMKKKFNLELDGEPFAEPVEDLAESSPCSPLKQLIDPTASNVPEEKELYFCHLCPARFLFRKELGIHSRFHNLHLVHTCDNCSYTSRQRSHMECHVKVHTEDYQDRTTDLLKMYKVNKEFPMPRIVCVNHKAGTVGNVWIVIEAPESPPPAPKFSCSKCPATFYKTEAYQAHVMLHGSNNPHKCRICDYAVKTYGNLIKHMISHGCRASVAKKILQGRMEVPESLRPKTGTLQESESSTPQIVPKEEPQPPEDAENQNGAESMETECGSSTEADGVPMKEDLGMDVDDHHNVAYGEKSDSEVKDKENSPAETALSTNDSAPASGSPEFVYPTHFRNGRVKAKKYKCPKCPSAFEKRHQYHVHLKLHGSKQRYKCTKCDYSVKFYANFKQHLLRHQQSEDAKGGRDDSESSTNEGEEAIPENSENVRSLTPPSPSRSAKTTGGKGEKLSVADQQAIMVLQQRRAKRAAISRESLDKNYWCSHCPYSNPRRDQVESHMRRHIAVSGVCNTFVCDHCDYSVPNKHFLRDHCKLHFDVSKAPRPDAYMICDSLELYASSGFIGKGKSKGKMLIFQDKGFNATSDRFIPPLPSDTNEDSTDAADRIYINLKTFESERFCDNGSKDNADDSREVENNPEFEKEADAEQSEESAEESSSKCGLEDCHESPHSTECGISEADLTQVASSVSVEAGKLD